MQICLVRHGQANWQLDRAAGLDSELTALGHSQSASLAHWLRKLFSSYTGGSKAAPKLMTSPLRRARQTASYVERALSTTSDVCPQLSEAPFQVSACLPGRSQPFAAADTAAALDPRYLCYKAQVLEGFELICCLSRQHDTVIVVTHGGFIKTTLRLAIDSDNICFDISNASMTELTWRVKRWHIVRLDYHEYLHEQIRSR